MLQVSFMFGKLCQFAFSVAVKLCCPCVLMVCVEQMALHNFIRKMGYPSDFLRHRFPKTNFSLNWEMKLKFFHLYPH